MKKKGYNPKLSAKRICPYCKIPLSEIRSIVFCNECGFQQHYEHGYNWDRDEE